MRSEDGELRAGLFPFTPADSLATGRIGLQTRTMRIFLLPIMLAVVVLCLPSVGFAKIALTYEPTKLDPVVKKLAVENLEAPVQYAELALPRIRSIGITFQDCGDPNAWYEPSQRRIVFCYELIAYLAKNAISVFSETERSELDDDLAPGAFHQAMLFVLFHELAHAHIDLARRKITGAEEDVADQLATFMMWNLDVDAVSMVGGFVFFKTDEAADLDVWDEHSPDQRRLANLACWSYGAEPETTEVLFAAVGKALGDPEGMSRRKTKCAQEWSRISSAWSRSVKVAKEVSTE